MIATPSLSQHRNLEYNPHTKHYTLPLPSPPLPLAHVCADAGLLVTLQILYLRLTGPACVTSTFSPLISLANLTRWLSESGRLRLGSWMPRTSDRKSRTGCLL